MAAGKYDRYMVAIGAARHLKLRRLSVPERYAFFLGVLSIAAQSPLRGRLLIGNLRAEAEDVAHEAEVPVAVARTAMDKLRQVGLVISDDEHDCERVHDFDDWNPAPKRDTTAADRQQRRRDRVREQRDASRVTPVTKSRRHTPEVEEEVEGTPESSSATPPTRASVNLSHLRLAS